MNFWDLLDLRREPGRYARTHGLSPAGRNALEHFNAVRMVGRPLADLRESNTYIPTFGLFDSDANPMDFRNNAVAESFLGRYGNVPGIMNMAAQSIKNRPRMRNPQFNWDLDMGQRGRKRWWI